MTYEKFSEILDLLDHGRFTADQLIQLARCVEASYQEYYSGKECLKADDFKEEYNGEVQ